MNITVPKCNAKKIYRFCKRIEKYIVVSIITGALEDLHQQGTMILISDRIFCKLLEFCYKNINLRIGQDFQCYECAGFSVTLSKNHMWLKLVFGWLQSLFCCRLYWLCHCVSFHGCLQSFTVSVSYWKLNQLSFHQEKCFIVLIYSTTYSLYRLLLLSTQ